MNFMISIRHTRWFWHCALAPACTFIRDYLPGSPFVATPRMETSLKSYCVRPVRSLLHSWLPSPSIFLSLSLHHHSAAATSAPLSHYSFDGHSHSPLPASAKNRNELGRDCSLHDMRYARNFLIIKLWSETIPLECCDSIPTRFSPISW